MPRYKKTREKYYMERIAAVLAFNPRAGNQKIREILQEDFKDPITLDHWYIGKLKNKLLAERKYKIDTTKVEQRLAEMQMKFDAVIAQMAEILISPVYTGKERVAAGKVILDADKALFDAQMDAGVYERKLGEFSHRHQLVLDPVRRAKIVEALNNLGLLKNGEYPALGAATNADQATTADVKPRRSGKST